jgi:hypothetical protein
LNRNSKTKPKDLRDSPSLRKREMNLEENSSYSMTAEKLEVKAIDFKDREIILFSKFENNIFKYSRNEEVFIELRRVKRCRSY